MANKVLEMKKQLGNENLTTVSQTLKGSINEVNSSLADIEYNIKNNIGMVTNSIWTQAIQSALDNYKKVYIPYSATPYIIDDRLLISSGTTLRIHPQAVIYLANNTNTCMIRNKNMLSTDFDINIEGGIWDGNYANNTQNYSYSDKTSPLRGVAGVISMIGVAKYSIRNLVVRSGRGFGIQSCQCSNFLIENIEFVTHQRDGVHISGQNDNFIVRNIVGSTKDDFVALNAWDWYNSTPAYGNITNGLVEKLHCNHAGGCAVKVLPGGSYTIDNVNVRNVSGITNDASFKIQNDTDLETPSNTITAGSVGKLIYEKISCYAINSCNNFLLGTAIDHLEINDFNINSSQVAPFIVQKAGFITKNLILQNLKNNTAIATSQLINVLGTIENLILNGTVFNSINTGGDYFLAGVQSGGRIINLFINNSRFNQGAGILRTYAGSLACNVQMTNSYIYMLKHTFYPNTTLTIKMSNCTWDSIPATNDIVRIDQSTAVVTVYSNNCEFINSTGALPFTKVAGTIRWNGTDIPVDVSLLTPSGSDIANNNNSSLACGKGIVVRDTGNIQWKNLFTGLTL
jgi:hypothetical protein